MRVAAVQVTAVTRGVSVSASAMFVVDEQPILFTYRCDPMMAAASAWQCVPLVPESRRPAVLQGQTMRCIALHGLASAGRRLCC